MLGNFSDEAQFILLKARDEMIQLHHPYIGTEHMMLSMLKNESDISKRLEKYGLNYDIFRKEIIDIIGVGTKESKFFLHTPLLKKVIENAMLDAKDFNHGEVTPEYLLAALLEEGEGIAIRIFVGMGIDLDEMYSEFNSKLVKKSKKRKKKLLIEELGVDLIDKARNHQIDPVVGREHEVERLVEILCRRNKNNPILIGEAGVGKTAIVEELASRIACGDVPNILIDKRIISVDMATLVSGTKYRGEFEERMQKVIREITDDENIILFIDEIHTLVGAGGAEGAIDASNILKPALARGNIRCIGATTTSEYKKYIEVDKALARRFQKILVEEPDEKGTIYILEKLKAIYEKYHHVIIPQEIIKSIVELSNQYIFDRHNPDKAIDVLDEVASRVSVKETEEEKRIRDLYHQLSEVKKKKNAFILDNDVDKAYDFLKEETLLSNTVHDMSCSIQKDVKKISLQDVAKVIHDKSGVPVYEIMKDDISFVSKFENDLKSVIIGQDEAICELVKTTKKIKLGFSNHKVKSFLFVGPTGVGKTNLAKLYASLLVGSQNLIRLDMSEFSDATSLNKIIGSSPGYVGYQDQNTVLTKLKEKQHCVLLLDEIDKAHSSVINLLYQMLDEGEIKDATNQTISLKHSIVIMTSNLGFEESKVGFQKSSNEVMSGLRQKFPSSLVNRIDYIIPFHYLKEKDIIQIVQKKLMLLKKKYPDLEYEKSLVRDIVEVSQYQIYGARRINKIIETDLENLLIDRMINHQSMMIRHLKEEIGTL